jgi:hypothetical protein
MFFFFLKKNKKTKKQMERAEHGKIIINIIFSKRAIYL